VATAVFSNGILFGETIPTVFTTPFGVLATRSLPSGESTSA